MEYLISLLLGFLIAFIGILPPGMLNMMVAKLSVNENKKAGLLFGYGAGLIVVLQCFLGLYFAKFLDSHPVVSENLKKFAVLIFIVLTFVFIYNGLKPKKEKAEVTIENKKNRFLYGMILSSFNMFAIPYYVFASLTLSSKYIFKFSTSSNLFFVAGAGLGTLLVFHIYVSIFKKIENKVGFLIKNINFIIAAITGIVAISSIYKMVSS
ncbi:LysE family transporter [Flavobacterium jejuense]|uniref:LysE family transporter n=1 Tax=Flavobacterium jejuense TaxID=1544455 RepID=A0ABX0ITK4_9FLAO|nr:LysE family transporter [Flavobacterium jejuense]NHN27038.1 LysE family transporter [Flavobacterium jejuense]